jgi:protein involved in plasmid replication-relaxation
MTPAPSLQPPKPLERLTWRQEEILRAMATLHFATRLDIAHLPACAGLSDSQLRKILAALSGGDNQPNQYLCRFSRPQITRGALEKVYTLGALGRRYLFRQLGEPVTWWYSPAKASNHSFSYLLHQLTLSRLVCAAEQWARQQTGYRLTHSLLSYALAHIAPSVTIQRAQEQIPLTVVPDVLLCFEREDEKYPLLIEIDRGTEFQERFKTHVKARIQLIRSGAHKHYLGIDALCVAYITTGVTSDYRESRLEAIRAWTKEVIEEETAEKHRQAWFALFRFTSLPYEEIYERVSGLLTDAVWYGPDSETKVPLWSECPTKPHEENEHGNDDTNNPSD